MTLSELRATLDSVQNARVTVFGDFCVDAYWFLDEGELEYSIETGLPLRRVREQRYSLGGAANVVANLMDLGVKRVHAVGVAGSDLFGNLLVQLLTQKHAQVDGFVTSPEWQTMVYAKPCRGQAEENRLDFGAFNELNPQLAERLTEALRDAVLKSDVVILNQQVPRSISAGAMVARINTIMEENPEVQFIVDARHIPEAYAPTMLKLNASEAARLLQEKPSQDFSATQAVDFAARLHARHGKPAFVTCGAHGIAVASKQRSSLVAGMKITGPIDTVGAGDSVVAALAAALGSCHTPEAAAQLANLAAAVTVRKLRVTGTATPEEIVTAAAEFGLPSDAGQE
jgi:rfaE bifunctional protein kinase chain/domain